MEVSDWYLKLFSSKGGMHGTETQGAKPLTQVNAWLWHKQESSVRHAVGKIICLWQPINKHDLYTSISI
jgi:hypothetical protein